MTDTSNGHRALPWRSEGYRVFDADGIEVANTFTPELALGSAKAVAKDIVEAANAHYGDKDARIAELERQLSEASRNAKWMADANQKFEVRIWEEQKRAEAAEARLKDANSDRWKLLLRAEDTDAEVHDLQRRAKKAEARVRELEKTHTPDTFTAPDGRAFRVGQRVWHIWDEPGEFGHVTDINGGFPFVQFRDANDQTHPDNLRRVWDGLEEPDVPVGTVLRDSYGCYLERLHGTRWEPCWELRDEKGDLVDNDEWINLDGEQFRPYVEVLPGDDE